MIPKSIMLVEDNIDDEYLAIRILRKAGINEIGIADDGRKALDLLLSPDRVLPEIVILDLRLPGIEGLKLFAELRRNERTMTLPVIVLTSSDDPKDREECLKLGATAFLIKPLELSDLQKVFQFL